MTAVVEHHHRGNRDAQSQNRLHEHDAQHSGQAGLGKQVIGALELLPFVILPNIGLDHPDGDQVFLDLFVQVVNGLLHLLKQRMADVHQPTHAHS